MNNGDLAVTNMDKANTLNEYFSGVFIPEDIFFTAHVNPSLPYPKYRPFHRFDRKYAHMAVFAHC